MHAMGIPEVKGYKKVKKKVVDGNFLCTYIHTNLSTAMYTKLRGQHFECYCTIFRIRWSNHKTLPGQNNDKDDTWKTVTSSVG